MTNTLKPIDYKDTLNLADTSFPMRANLAQREPSWLQTLSGYDAPYVPGWDCHGLPIEQKVESEHGKVGQKITATEFRKLCREYANTQIELQKADFKRLGVFGDWDNPYLTMNPKQEANIVRALGKIYDNGYVVRGMKPVNWCLDCGSALAEAEVDYQDKISDAIYVGFDVIDNDKLGVSVDDVVKAVIWTTTPWTLPANQAISVHPKENYSVVKTDKGHLLLATDLVNDALMALDLDNLGVISTIKGSELEWLQAQHPLIAKRQVPIILGEHVTTDSGTGLVHTAPGHGADDYVVGQQYGLETENPVSGNGVYLETAKVFAGTHIYKANPLIIETLNHSGHLLKHSKIEHSYPHCWRHKAPIIFRATPQWFIGMEGFISKEEKSAKQQKGLREQTMMDIPNVIWTPQWGQNRIEAKVGNRPDWCISRQRTWGVPIPFFTHKDTGELHPDTSSLIEKAAQLIEKGGIEAWFDAEISDFLADDADQYVKSTDTLDVWFDSGTTHFAVLEQTDALTNPADMYLEGSDQHRGWFQTSLLTSEAIYARPPFKQVLTHGFVVDENGRKMSKSLGNIITPQDEINKTGADMLRLWIASSDYRYEMSAGAKVFKGTVDMYRRIRNTIRFLLANTDDFNPMTDAVAMSDMVSLDKFIMHQAMQVQKSIIQSYDNMDFHQVTQAVTAFCSQDLGGFCLDIIKDRTYTTKADGHPRRSAQTAIYHIAHALIRWIAPILTFTAQEAWEVLKGTDGYVFTQHWHEFPALNLDSVSSDDWQRILSAKDVINKQIELAREQKIINANLRFVFITSDAQLYQRDG